MDSKVGLDLHASRSEPIDRHGLGGSALLIHLAGADFLLLRVSRFPLRPFTPQPHEFLVLHSTVSFIPICVTECLRNHADVPPIESHSLVDTVGTARLAYHSLPCSCPRVFPALSRSTRAWASITRRWHIIFHAL